MAANDADESLRRATEDLTAEIRALRQQMARRPTRRETVVYRRGATIALIALLVGTIFMHDVHVEWCGPGARADFVLERLTADDAPPSPVGRDYLIEWARDSIPHAFCDMTFPIHAHGGEQWPTWPNVAGILVLLAFVVALVTWWRAAYRVDQPNPEGDPDA